MPKRRASKSKKNKTGMVEFPISRNLYNGPIQTRLEKLQEDTHTVLIPSYQAVASDGGGTIATVISSNPNGAPKWSSYALIYDEFRVLGFEIKFFPNNRYSKTTTTCTPLCGVVDHDNATALSAYTTAAEYASFKMLSLEDPSTMVAKMADFNEAQFTNTNAPVAQYWIKLFSTGLTVSTTYGGLFLYWKVQFRGVGV